MISPSCPLVRRFWALTRAAPHRAAVLASQETPALSRAALWERALALAETLRPLARQGEVVVVSLPNSWECVAAFLGARALGLRVALVDSTAPERELERCAAVVGARLVVASSAARGRRVAQWAGAMISARCGDAVELPAPTAVLKLTSGSTGSPRAVALSVRQLTADAVQIIRTMGLRGDDVTLAAIPLTHSYGLGSCLMPLLLAGIPLVFPSSKLPAALLAALRDAAVTHFPAVPAMIRALAALPDLSPFPHLRLCLAAGAPLDPVDAAAFRARTGIKVHVFYGSSECGGITYDASDGAIAEKGKVGTPLWRVQVQVVGEDGRPCPPGVEGRVQVCSPAVGLGVVPAPNGDNPISGRVFATADAGIFDETGQLTLTGRLTAALNVAGKKVHPEEIRRTLEAVPGVRGAVVMGLPEGHRGELVVALVAVDPTCGLTGEHLLAHCRTHLAPHKVPHRLVLVDELPSSERGKVRREEVMAILTSSSRSRGKGS